MWLQRSAVTVLVIGTAVPWTCHAEALWKRPVVPEYSGALTADNIKRFAEDATHHYMHGRFVKLDIRLKLTESGLIVQRSSRNVTVMQKGAVGWKLLIEGEYPVTHDQTIHFNGFYLQWRWNDGVPAYVLANDQKCKSSRNPLINRVGI